MALVCDVVYLVDSARLKPLPEGEASVPHPAWAWDHAKAKESVRRLAALDPLVVGTGHEQPLRGESLRETLEGPPRSTERPTRGRWGGIVRPAAISCLPDDRDLRLGGADLRRLAAGRAGDLLARRAARRGAGWSRRSGFGAILTVTGVLARAPGHGTSATLGIVVLIVVAAAGRLAAARTARRARCGSGLPVAVVVARRAGNPVRRQRPLGPARRRLQQRPRAAPRLGRVAAQRLRAGAGPRLPARPARAGGGDGGGAGDRPRPGLRRRDRRDRRAHRADRAGRAARDAPPGGGSSRATLVAVPYLAASYFAQAAFKETAEALFVLAFAIYLTATAAAAPPAPADLRPRLSAGALAARWPWPAASSSPTASPGSPGRSRSSPSGA